MKKNNFKNAYWYKENIKKYQVGLLLFNMFLFIFVFGLFCGLIGIFIEQKFIYNVETDITTYLANIDTYIQEDGLNKNNDPRMTIVYYFIDSGSVLPSPTDFKVDDYKVVGYINEAFITSKEEIMNETFNEFKKEKIDNHYYMSYAIKKRAVVLNPDDDSFDTMCCLKLYMNIDSELSSQNDLKSSLVIMLLGVLIMGYGLAYLVMRKSVEPLKNFVEKQVTFVSDASHELRTPLAIVQSKIENILAEPEKTVYEVSEDLAVSLKELSRLTKLTSELLSLARSDQNRLTYNLEVVNLNIVLQEIIEPFIEIASFEDRTLTYSGIDIDVEVDKDKFRELVIILLDNAMKYTNANDAIEVKLYQKGNEAIFEVNDTGIGIKDEDLTKVFEKFYREDKTRSRETGGNGLGLSIAKTIVNDLNGKIYAEHNEPKGTKFIVILPKCK